MGKVVLAMTWRPVIGALFALSRRVSDGEGRNPGWLSGLLGKVFAGVWTMYDLWMKKAFGDGERTIEEGGEGVV